ncbi:MAG: YqiA/YcfP family alpha/beta fold hydrolase [Acidobacteriota bacterium]
MRVVYLHGFASSPQSTKARFFGDHFAEAGVAFDAPQLDEGQFHNLTITGQMLVVGKAVATQAEKLTPGEPLVLMGSSLGGYLAALYAARHPRYVDRLVLLAPAFRFLERWRVRLSPTEIEQWKRDGSILMYHYGSKTAQRLGYQFLEDAAGYEAVPDFHQRALILHGTNDTVVPCQVSYDFALEHVHARLALFESGHELTDVLEGLWREASAFLEIP